jgi:uncharacterized membrane protein YbhN (UPF0104 family)
VPAEPLFALSVFGIGSVVGGVSMLLGGIGAAEANIAGLLISLSYTAAVATSATIVVRVGTLCTGQRLGALVSVYSNSGKRVRESPSDWLLALNAEGKRSLGPPVTNK